MSSFEIQFDHLGIVGVGLIGGSIARAAKTRGIVRTVTGCGRNRARLESAREQSVIDEITTDLSELSNADLIIVCTPVDHIANDVCRLLEITQSPTLITDAGSVKGTIVQKVQQQAVDANRFIGAHPLAGSHLTGFENADPNLFADRTCVLTPTNQNAPEDVEKLQRFWSELGMRVNCMTAEEHDRILALTSHLPHLAASAVAAMIEEQFIDYASTGYRDTTRVAAGDPALWTAIFSQNSRQLVSVTDQLIESLRQFRNALTLSREADVLTFLKTGQDHRKAFRDHENAPNAE